MDPTPVTAVPASVAVSVDGRQVRLLPPRWGSWQAALDRAAGTGGTVDPQALVEECLLVCVRAADGRELTRLALAALSADAGDRLVGAMMELLDRQRADLLLAADGGCITGTGFALQARPWSFGERNAALRGALRLEGGNVIVDLIVYELQMVLQCVTADGRALSAAEVHDWPVPLGETVLQVLDGLNGVAPAEAELLAACVRTGTPHPDLTLVELCRAFGWSPAEVERLDARTAERMWAAVRVASAGGVPARADMARLPSGPERDEEGVTRIVVQDG